MKFLVTGGAGLIESRPAEKLLDRGESVVALDDPSSGSLENLQHLLPRQDFHFVAGSAADTRVVRELVDECDTIIHLAAAVGVRLILERPVHTIENNLFAAGTVLAAAADAVAAGKQRLVLIASTPEVSGKNLNPPFCEEDDLTLGSTINSRWAYACSKVIDEWLGFAYHPEKGVPVIIAKFFNTVVPRQTGRYGMVLPNSRNRRLKANRSRYSARAGGRDASAT